MSTKFKFGGGGGNRTHVQSIYYFKSLQV